MLGSEEGGRAARPRHWGGRTAGRQRAQGGACQVSESGRARAQRVCTAPAGVGWREVSAGGSGAATSPCHAGQPPLLDRALPGGRCGRQGPCWGRGAAAPACSGGGCAGARGGARALGEGTAGGWTSAWQWAGRAPVQAGPLDWVEERCHPAGEREGPQPRWRRARALGVRRATRAGEGLALEGGAARTGSATEAAHGAPAAARRGGRMPSRRGEGGNEGKGYRRQRRRRGRQRGRARARRAGRRCASGAARTRPSQGAGRGASAAGQGAGAADATGRARPSRHGGAAQTQTGGNAPGAQRKSGLENWRRRVRSAERAPVGAAEA
jgi:hypothetical protein